MVVRGEAGQGLVHPDGLSVSKEEIVMWKLRRHHMFLVPCYIAFEELS